MSTLSAPNQREPWLDQRTGQVSRYWLRFLQDLFTRVGGAESIDLAEVATAITAILVSVNDDKIDSAFNQQAAQIIELKKEVEELKQLLAFQQPTQTVQEVVYDSVFS